MVMTTTCYPTGLLSRRAPVPRASSRRRTPCRPRRMTWTRISPARWWWERSTARRSAGTRHRERVRGGRIGGALDRYAGASRRAPAAATPRRRARRQLGGRQRSTCRSAARPRRSSCSAARVPARGAAATNSSRSRARRQRVDRGPRLVARRHRPREQRLAVHARAGAARRRARTCSSADGDVLRVSRTMRATRSASTRPVGATCSIADCVSEPTILCVEVSTASAPSCSALAGRPGWKPKCGPHAWSTTSGTPAAWQTAAQPSTSAAMP